MTAAAPAARIAMWSGPRTVSTAMMRAWENRPETNATHLFLVLPGDLASSYAAPASGGAVLATPTAASAPEGVTRGAVLSLAARQGIAIQVGDYTLPQLCNAAEAFVTGTMGGLAPVTEVDGRVIGDGAPGPVTRRLTGLYADLTASSGTIVA